jgi:hypothetical protein
LLPRSFVGYRLRELPARVVAEKAPLGELGNLSFGDPQWPQRALE